MHELPFLKVKRAVCYGRGFGIMSHHHDGLAVVVGERGEEGENGSGGFAVEVAGRFIGDEEPWVMNNCSGNGDALFLASGEFGRAVMRAIGEANEIKGGIDASPAL